MRVFGASDHCLLRLSLELLHALYIDHLVKDDRGHSLFAMFFADFYSKYAIYCVYAMEKGILYSLFAISRVPARSMHMRNHHSRFLHQVRRPEHTAACSARA